MMKIMQTIVPRQLRVHLRSLFDRTRWMDLHRSWTAERRRIALAEGMADGGPNGGPTRARAPAGRFLIFPADLSTLHGSRGDEAMISACLQGMVHRFGPSQASVFCFASATDAVRAASHVPIVLPAASEFPAELSALCQSGQYDALIVLGADILDGHYGPVTALWRLVAADVATRNHLPTTILGGSFNGSPAPELRAVFDALDPRLRVNMRDEVSFARMKAFSSVNVRLVADVAFCLKPGIPDPAFELWVETERAAGRKVIGVNLHPMLFPAGAAPHVDRLVDMIAAAAVRVSGAQPVSWAILPHDERPKVGDEVCLRPLHRKMAAAGLRVRYLGVDRPAAEIKAAAGLLDGIVTGRMHLAIAGLGGGVPTLCLAYQGKFEGLYRSFGLPADLLLDPERMLEEGAFEAALDRFLADLPALRDTVAGHRAAVLALAALNFDMA